MIPEGCEKPFARIGGGCATPRARPSWHPRTLCTTTIWPLRRRRAHRFESCPLWYAAVRHRPWSVTGVDFDKNAVWVTSIRFGNRAERWTEKYATDGGGGVMTFTQDAQKREEVRTTIRRILHHSLSLFTAKDHACDVAVRPGLCRNPARACAVCHRVRRLCQEYDGNSPIIRRGNGDAAKQGPGT